MHILYYFLFLIKYFVKMGVNIMKLTLDSQEGSEECECDFSHEF